MGKRPFSALRTFRRSLTEVTYDVGKCVYVCVCVHALVRQRVIKMLTERERVNIILCISQVFTQGVPELIIYFSEIGQFFLNVTCIYIYHVQRVKTV